MVSIRVVAPRSGSKPEPVSRRLIKKLIHSERNALIGTVLFAPDGKWIAGYGLYGKGGVQIWDALTGKQLRNISLPEGYSSQFEPLPVSPDGHRLYIPIQREQTIRITKDGQPAIRHEVDGETQVWDLPAGRQLSSLRHTPPRGVHGAALSVDGNWLAAVERRVNDNGNHTTFVISLWDVQNRTSRDLAEGRQLPRFAPDGKTLAACLTDSENKRRGLVLWDVASGKSRIVLHTAADFYGVPIFSPDGRYIAASQIGPKRQVPEVRIWEAATGKEIGTFAAPESAEFFQHLVFSPDGRRLVAATLLEGKIFLYDVPNRKLIRVRDLGKNVMLRDPAFSPDGKWLAVPGQALPEGVQHLLKENPLELPQPRVFLFDVAADNEPEIIVAPHGFVGRVAFRRDGRTLALGGYGCVWLFDMLKAAN